MFSSARRAVLALAVFAGAGLTALPALAHPRLLQSTPAAGATVAPPSRIELRFSEPLVARFTGGDLVMTRMMMGGQMMDHEMKIGGVTATVSPDDRKVLILTLKRPLAPGAYRLDWRAVSTDTHHVKGQIAFTVR